MSRWRLLSGGRATHPAGPLAPRKADRLLVAILTGVPRLQRLDGRQELLEEADGLLRDITPEHPAARDHLRAVIRAGRRTGKLESLRDALSYLEPDDIGAAWFALTVTVLTSPTGPLPADVMTDLICELQDWPPEFGRSTVSRYVSERRDTGRPLDTGSLPQVLVRLYDARIDATDPAAPRRRLTRFLELLGEEAATHDPRGRLTRLTARAADRRGGTAVGAHPGGAVADPHVPDPAGRVDADRQVIIQIRVEEEGEPTDLPYTRRLYSLNGFHYESVGEARPHFHCSRSAPDLFTGDELERRGHDFLVAWAAQEDVDRGTRKRVEFLLPDSLLGYPAELWPGGPAGIPLSRSCQVVVRCLTRYKDSSIHGEWSRRWAALDRDRLPGDALERIGWMGPTCPDGGKYPPLRLTDPADVEEWLRRHADLACLGLGAPYDPHDGLMREAVRDALLEDGIPAMVWRRDGGDPELLLDALRDGKPPAVLAELPPRVLEARRRDRRDPSSLSKQITLLWDDPTCVFSGQDPQMSGTRRAGEGAA